MSGPIAPNQAQLKRSETGFSLIEILVVILILAIATGMATEIVTDILPGVRADNSVELVVAQLRQARQAAIDQRRNFIVTFKGANEITVVRQELDGALTPIADNFLSQGVIYTVFPTVPDTPDGFGNGLPVNFAGGNTVIFLGDDTATDGMGRLVNGTVFMGILGKPSAARAVTVMGATARIKGYSYNGTRWF